MTAKAIRQRKCRRCRPAAEIVVAGPAAAAAFAALAAIFLVQLMSGRDTAEIPSALIGQPAPATRLAALDGSGLPGPILAVQGQGDRAQRLVVMVRALPREHPILLASPGTAASTCRARLQGPAGQGPEVPGGLRHAVLDDRRRSGRPRGDRLGRLRRPGNVRRRQGRQDRLQACRAADGGLGEGELLPQIEKALAAKVARRAGGFTALCFRSGFSFIFAWRQPESLLRGQIDARQCRFLVFLPLALVVIMLGLGLSLTVQDFRNVMRSPRR